MLTPTDRLAEAVAAACPVDGVSVGVRGQPATVRIDFRPEATPAQRPAAAAALAAFDWSGEAQAAWEADRKPERKAVRAAAAQAVADNEAFLAVASPTNAQVLAQVRRLTQQMNRLIPFVAKQD